VGTREFSRTERVAESIRRELGDVLTREAGDRRFRHVTLSGVELSRDLAHAKVFVTPAEGTDAEELIEALNGAKGFIRREIARRLNLRGTPEFRFVHDPTLERAMHLTALIDAAVAADRGEPGGRGGGSGGEGSR